MTYPLTWSVTTYCNHQLDQTGLNVQPLDTKGSRVCPHCQTEYDTKHGVLQ